MESAAVSRRSRAPARTGVVALLLAAFPFALAAPTALAEGGEHPCVDCDAYDIGWFYAQSLGLTSLDECGADDEEDPLVAEFQRGCDDYVLRRLGYSAP